jgi:MFS transporter, DHA1 family, tetracycline resistance protein
MKRTPLIILFVTLFIDLLGFGMIMPLLPNYITHYGGRPWVGGALLASFSAMQFIFSPIWGRVSDIYGRRPMILLSLLGSAVSYFFFGMASNLVILFAARVASGILTAASMPTAQAYIADVTPPEKRAGGMAMIGAAFGLGFAFGPVMGGVLSQHPVLGIPPLAMPAIFASALALCNFVWAFLALPETHHDRAPREEAGSALDAFRAMGKAFHNPAVRAQLLVFAFVTFAFTAIEASFSWLVVLRFKDTIHQMAVSAWQAHHATVFASLPAIQQTQLVEKASASTMSTMFAIVGVTILVVQGAVMGGLARRVGESRLVVFGVLVLTGTLIGLAFVQSIPMVWLLSGLTAVGMGVTSPSLSALITKAAGPQERGTLSGAQQGLGSLARIIAPPINNRLIEVNTAIPFLSSAVLMGVAFFLSLSLRDVPRTEADAASSFGH